MDTIAIECAGPDIGQIAVKNLIGVFGKFDAAQFAFSGFVKQANLDLGSVG